MTPEALLKQLVASSGSKLEFSQTGFPTRTYLIQKREYESIHLLNKNNESQGIFDLYYVKEWLKGPWKLKIIRNKITDVSQLPLDED